MKLAIFTLIAIILPIKALAETLSPRLTQASINLEKFLPNGRHPLVTQGTAPGSELGYRLSSSITTTFLHCGYASFTVTGITDETQFRYVSLGGQVGCQVLPFVSVFYGHLSEHTLDFQQAQSFPVQDSVGIKLNLLGGGSSNPLIRWRRQ